MVYTRPPLLTLFIPARESEGRGRVSHSKKSNASIRKSSRTMSNLGESVWYLEPEEFLRQLKEEVTAIRLEFGLQKQTSSSLLLKELENRFFTDQEKLRKLRSSETGQDSIDLLTSLEKETASLRKEMSLQKEILYTLLMMEPEIRQRTLKILQQMKLVDEDQVADEGIFSGKRLKDPLQRKKVEEEDTMKELERLRVENDHLRDALRKERERRMRAEERLKEEKVKGQRMMERVRMDQERAKKEEMKRRKEAEERRIRKERLEEQKRKEEEQREKERREQEKREKELAICMKKRAEEEEEKRREAEEGKRKEEEEEVWDWDSSEDEGSDTEKEVKKEERAEDLVQTWTQKMDKSFSSEDEDESTGSEPVVEIIQKKPPVVEKKEVKEVMGDGLGWAVSRVELERQRRQEEEARKETLSIKSMDKLSFSSEEDEDESCGSEPVVKITETKPPVVKKKEVKKVVGDGLCWAVSRAELERPQRQEEEERKKTLSIKSVDKLSFSSEDDEDESCGSEPVVKITETKPPVVEKKEVKKVVGDGLGWAVPRAKLERQRRQEEKERQKKMFMQRRQESLFLEEGDEDESDASEPVVKITERKPPGEAKNSKGIKGRMVKFCKKAYQKVTDLTKSDKSLNIQHHYTPKKKTSEDDIQWLRVLKLLEKRN